MMKAALNQDDRERLGSFDRLPSPKLSVVDKARSIYPYYAGFSLSFAESLLDRLGVEKGARVLDPWNGSGTTTTAAWRRGAKATGVDLNPVLVDIARARCAPRSAALLLQDVYRAEHRFSSMLAPSGPSAAEIGKFFEAACKTSPHIAERSDCADLLRVALYSTIRLGAGRLSNPTWLSRPKDEDFSSHTFAARFESEVRRIADLQCDLALRRGPKPSLRRGDFATCGNLRPAHYDFVVTSPPYLTRVDYVRATYPELSYVGELEGLSLEEMRRSMLGTTLTNRMQRVQSANTGSEAQRVLALITEHKSKASSTYYKNFFSQYFVGLSFAVNRIASLLRRGGRAALVVQNSHYKELEIDLAKVVVEMGVRSGLRLQAVEEFAQRRSIVSINSRSWASKSTMPSEYLVVMQKAAQ